MDLDSWTIPTDASFMLVFWARVILLLQQMLHSRWSFGLEFFFFCSGKGCLVADVFLGYVHAVASCLTGIGLCKRVYTYSSRMRTAFTLWLCYSFDSPLALYCIQFYPYFWSHWMHLTGICSCKQQSNLRKEEFLLPRSYGCGHRNPIHTGEESPMRQSMERDHTVK